MGRIDGNSWVSVETYNANSRGKRFNRELATWVSNHLLAVNHRCLNSLNVPIHNPREFVNSRDLFRVDVGIQHGSIPGLFNNHCIFCVDVEQTNLDENLVKNDEKIIAGFFDSMKAAKNHSTVPTTKTMFAWWPDLFIPLDRTHNYNNIAFEFQTYGVTLPINRSNEIQKIRGVEYVKILRVIQLQLHRWMSSYNKNQMDLRRLDSSAENQPFLRVIDKSYW